ncbi:MAG: cytochrome c [Sphingomonadales bacterium]|nr:cytochrome c [Sphingomonadales bacterium]NCQ21646.1 cytochrome c [Sphingomonadales bacterium]NCT04639.1 cytochrome c [Sphingomonadales bacterium]
MLRSPTARFLIAATLSGVLIACSGDGANGNAGSGEGPPIIKERQDNFEGIGDAFKAVRGELEKDTPDFILIAASASDINTRAAKIEGHFPTGTSVDDGFDTEALPAIWEKPEAFKAAAQKLVDESAMLVTVAGQGDKAATSAQAMTMGGACKGCHDKFRLDDEK